MLLRITCTEILQRNASAEIFLEDRNCLFKQIKIFFSFLLCFIFKFDCNLQHIILAVYSVHYLFDCVIN